MKQALEALEIPAKYVNGCDLALGNRVKAAAALRTAIELAEKQEPVAWNSGVPPLYPEIKDGETISVEYVEATPQPQEFVCSTGLCHYKSAAQRQPLTEEILEAIWARHQFSGRPSEVSFANRINLMRAVEAAHGIKEKNT